MHWEMHMGRLQRGAIGLGWDVSWLNEKKAEIAAWISASGDAACRLQLFPDVISVRLEAIPDPAPSYRLVAMNHPLGDLRADARATTLKGLLGTWDIQTRNHARDNLADDALLLWPDGTVAETTIAAIGLQLQNELFLPPPEGRISSITEAAELALWAKERGLVRKHRPIHFDEIATGQLWCMNALRGLWQAEVVNR
jgi:branched-subunit amino acid aminotransferase/4-amino-4-deoxychorismate lyase